MQSGTLKTIWHQILCFTRSSFPIFLVAVVYSLLLYAASHGAHMDSGIWCYLDISCWPTMGTEQQRPRMLADSIGYAGVFSVMVLVFLNTLVIFESILRKYRQQEEFGVTLTAGQTMIRQRARTLRSISIRLLIFVLILLVLWVLGTWSGYFFQLGIYLFKWRSPSEQHVGHELATVVIFFLFFAIDCLLLQATKSEIKLWSEVNNGKIEVKTGYAKDAHASVGKAICGLKIENRFQRDSIWLIDIPVILSVCVIFGVHHYLHENRWGILAERPKPDLVEDQRSAVQEALLPPTDLDIYFNDCERDGLLPVDSAGIDGRLVATGTRIHLLPSIQEISRQRQIRRFEGFLQGFSIGGLVVHVAISQFIFCLLLFRFRWDSRSLR